MYRVVKDNKYNHMYCLQMKIFGLFWLVIKYGGLEDMQEWKKRKEKREPRYTVVE